MSVHRVMGIETEYGIIKQGFPLANPMLMSSQLVTAYRAQTGLNRRASVRWDYHDEDPLSDARGYRIERASAHPSLLTDNPSEPVVAGPESSGWVEHPRPAVALYDDPSTANVVLTNGGRLYVDHAHPEYSSPEVRSPLAGVRWDVAGERIMRRACEILYEVTGESHVVYKNNIDGKGASYGTHENYLVSRSVPFRILVDIMTSFLVVRQVLTGSGRVGIGPTGLDSGFQISQRADYIEAEIGLETTLRRPIINTRDEPHADREKWRRLHLIIGDANLLETGTFLKLGMTSLVILLAERFDRLTLKAKAELSRLRLRNPVHAVQQVSRDLSLKTHLELIDGSVMTPIDVLDEYRRLVLEVLDSPEDPETQLVLDRWEDLCTRLRTDRDSCAREVEWVSKLGLLDRMREREGLRWNHPRLAALDLQWSDVRPATGIYQRLLAADVVERVVAEVDVLEAVQHPPRDTRAYFRGQVMARYSQDIDAASWDCVIFDVPGTSALQRVPMPDPHRGTEEHVGAILRDSPDAATLLQKIGSRRQG